MLLDDESSIGDVPEGPDPPKMFSNPFFQRKSSNPLIQQRPSPEIPPLALGKKPYSKRTIWESEKEESIKIPVPLGATSTTRNVLIPSKSSVGFSHTSGEGAAVHYMSTLPTDKVLQFSTCYMCSLPFEIGPQLDDHQRTCIGVDPKLESIPPAEVDRIMAYFDSVLEHLYVLLHQYAANYLSRFSVGTCVVVEDSTLRHAIDCISTNSHSQLSRLAEGLEASVRSISSSGSGSSPADRSAVCLIQAILRVAREKIALIEACPPRVKALIEKIKEVDLVTNSKLEELKLWKAKCSNFSASSFRPQVRSA